MKEINTSSRIYIPSIKDLEKMKEILQNSHMQDDCYNKNYNIDSYCLAKKVEIILSNGGLEYFDNEIKYDYNIVSKVIKYYPQDIWCTPFANDISLAKKIISNNENNNYKFGLDNIGSLSSELYENSEFIDNVIKNLLEILRVYPKYRFEYPTNELLDKIFAKKLSSQYLNGHYLDINNENILYIEPSYILDMDDSEFCDREFKEDKRLTSLRKGNALTKAIKGYATRYGIYSSYEKANEDTYKKLVRFLNEHKNN